jgi:acyl dehydratase
MADKTKVGKEYPPVIWEVEKGKIRELARAIGDPNPVYVDRDAAVAQGYKDVAASPTFLTVPAMWCNILATVLIDAEVNVAMVLHGEEEYEYLAEIYPGDVLTGVPRLAAVEEKLSKSGRTMDMVTIEVDYTNQRGEKAARARTLIVERK